MTMNSIRNVQRRETLVTRKSPRSKGINIIKLNTHPVLTDIRLGDSEINIKGSWITMKNVDELDKLARGEPVFLSLLCKCYRGSLTARSWFHSSRRWCEGCKDLGAKVAKGCRHA